MRQDPSLPLHGEVSLDFDERSPAAAVVPEVEIPPVIAQARAVDERAECAHAVVTPHRYAILANHGDELMRARLPPARTFPIAHRHNRHGDDCAAHRTFVSDDVAGHLGVRISTAHELVERRAVFSRNLILRRRFRGRAGRTGGHKQGQGDSGDTMQRLTP